MKGKIIKMLCAAFCCAAMAVCGPPNTLLTEAAGPTIRDTPKGIADFGRGDASIAITGNQGQTLQGKRFQIYQLFHAENSNGLESINYTFHKPFEKALKKVVGKRISKEQKNVTEYEVIDYIQSLKTGQTEGAYSDYRYFLEELRNEIVKEGIEGELIHVTKTNLDNSVTIEGLEFGYYLVDEVTSVEGTYSAASLCIVNTANPLAQVNIKSDYPSVIKKIQEDDNRETIGADGWNDIADFEIGQTVPYKFESDIPNIDGYDTYYYAWHDVMDEALTFHPESVGITIYESKAVTSKSYTLAGDEFSIILNPGGKETFQVEIPDIKAIVDREFQKGMYGQHVVLTYHATLNDHAALDTGRPGFENDVRLEFSNDADNDNRGSTGFTPWDTVVCFTYKINALKTNNHNLKLEGAKFRLFSDAACKREVYVKKMENGYHIINRDLTDGTIPGGATEMSSDENGVFQIYGLDSGTYYLKETKAPTGYRPLLDPIVLQVSAKFTNDRDAYVKGDGATDKTLQQLTATAYIRAFWNGAYQEQKMNLKTNVSDGSANLTVVNNVGNKMPATGSSITLVMLGAGTFLMTYAFIRKKKKR